MHILLRYLGADANPKTIISTGNEIKLQGYVRGGKWKVTDVVPMSGSNQYTKEGSHLGFDGPSHLIKTKKNRQPHVRC